MNSGMSSEEKPGLFIYLFIHLYWKAYNLDAVHILKTNKLKSKANWLQRGWPSNSLFSQPASSYSDCAKKGRAKKGKCIRTDISPPIYVVRSGLLSQDLAFTLNFIIGDDEMWIMNTIQE